MSKSLWLETILKAIASAHDSVDERLALVQDAIDQALDIGQVKQAVSEEVRHVVQEQLRSPCNAMWCMILTADMAGIASAPPILPAFTPCAQRTSSH